MVDDGNLRNRIEAVLVEEPQTRDFTFDILVEGGVVTLKGTVDRHEARQTAEELVRGQSGVVEVINDIEVRGEEEGPDDMRPVPPEQISGQ